MDLKEYLKLIKKNHRLIITVCAITGISTFLFSILRPITYDVSQSLFIHKNGSQETEDFKFDGYYAFEAADTLSDSIGEWLKSPEIVNEIYSRSGIDPAFKNIKSYSKKFKAKKLSAEFVEVKFESKNADEAGKISKAIIEVVNSKTTSFEKASNGEVSFLISGGMPVIVENKLDALASFVIGIASGLLLGIFIALSREYLH
ncbi:MAG: hypothetical protein WC788_06515 [Candidatus Paceibacterota bacterium]|jgi:capsular polysaccharide biosynthesis protein